MRALLLVSTLLLLGLPMQALGNCNSSPPPPPPEPPPPPRPESPFPGPPSSVPPGLRPAPETPGAEEPTPENEAPEGPTTPGQEDPPAPLPQRPDSEVPTGGDDDEPPPVGPDRGRPAAPKSGRPGRGKSSKGAADGWRFWWDFNRESVVGTRHMLHHRATITGRISEGAPDALGVRRDEVLTALRTIAQDSNAERKVRAASITALGRMGGAAEAELFMKLTRDRRQPAAVHEAAAVALGLLQPIDAPETRNAIRAHYDHYLNGKGKLTTKATDLLVIGAGLRARHDEALVMRLAQRADRISSNSDRAAALAYACGLAGDRMLAPELLNAALRSRLGRVELNDVGRGHAAMALGRMEDPIAAAALLRVLGSRRARIHTRRSVVMALGRLLRRNAIGDDRRKTELALLKALDKRGDTITRGFAAIALANNDKPAGIDECVKALGGANSDLRPYAALALGLAARSSEKARKKQIQDTLAKALERSKDRELSAALCVALGLSGRAESLPKLLGIVEDDSLPPRLRGAAANGAGLLGRGSAHAEKVLIDSLKDGPSGVVEESAMGLGFLGGRSVVRALLDMIPETKSSLARGRILIALGKLGHHHAVTPLLELLRNTKADPHQREHAAEALGLLGGSREVDPLFDLSVDFNYYATTWSTYQLLNQM